MKIGFKRIVLTTALACFAAPAALAQSADNPFLRGRHTAVTERQQPEFDSEPLRAGAFLLSPTLDLGADYNSNIFASPKEADNDTSDSILVVRPQLEVRSNWSSHELRGRLAVEHHDYIRYDTETKTEYDAILGGRLDVQRSFQLTGQVTGAHRAEPRFEPGSAGAANPIEYDQLGADAGAIFQSDRLRLQGNVGTGGSDYDTDANYRDVTENYVSARGSYAISPDVAFFVQGRTGDLDYESSDRDGTRSTVQVGANFELQAPFRGEIAVGTFKEEKDSAAYADTDGLSVDAVVEWFPTQLTTVAFRANQGVFDSGIVESPSTTSTTLGVRVDHELRRNILLFADFSTGKYEFESPPPPLAFDREDKFNDFSAGVGYRLNRHARLDVSYRFHDQSTSGLNAGIGNVEQHVIGIGLRLYP